MKVDHYILIFLLLLMTWCAFITPKYFTDKKDIKELRRVNDSLLAYANADILTDTFFSDTTVYVPSKPIIVRDSIYVHDTVNFELCRYIRTYCDTFDGGDATVYYELQTTGTLDDIDLWYQLHVPREIIKTKTIVLPPPHEPPFRAYMSMGVHIDDKVSVSVGGNIAMKRWAVGYYYDIPESEHGILISRRLY